MNESEFSTSLNWFDEEFKEKLALDVFDHEFPKHMGHMTIRTEKHNILILRVETFGQRFIRFLTISIQHL